MTTAVFGATGHLGAHVIDALLQRGTVPADLLALGRNQERLDELAGRGLRTARVDLSEPGSLEGVLDGVETVLLISASEPGKRVPQHRAVIDAAAAAGVRHLVYTSAPQARTSALVLAPEHKATEELIEASSIPATILRNGWYTENYTQDFATAREAGVIANSVGEGRVASAPRRDYAEAAAVVLTTPGHEGQVYELSGDVAWTFTEFAAAAQEVLGTPVRYEALTPEQEQERLVGLGLDEGTAGFVVALNGNSRDGLLGGTNGDLARLLGRPTEPLVDTLRSWV